MSTLTKEWLQQTIAELEEERDAVPGAVNEDAAMALAAMKLALSTLEAEAVEFLPKNLDRALTILGVALPVSKEEFNLESERWMQRLIDRVIRLESELVPPAPLVPTFDEWLELRGNKPLGWVKDAMRESYDACRDAMLQGDEQTKYRAIVERIAEIIHGKVTDIDLLTVTVKSMKDKLQK